MLRPDAAHRRFLAEATSCYQQNLPAVEEYLESRGIPLVVADAFRLGYVAEPYSIDHKPFTGRLAIPYLTRAGVVTIRFRCLEPHDCKETGCPKYLGIPKQDTPLFNVNSLFSDSPLLIITEGELDAIICSAMVGLPAVGAPGANSWKPHWSVAVSDFETVLVAGDGDQSGAEMVRKVCDSVPRAKGRQLPHGHDLTDLYLASGAEGVLETLGLGREQ